jgi:flagellar motor protein MotB
MRRVWSIIRFQVFVMFLALSMVAGLFFSQPLTAGFHEEKLISTDSYSTLELEFLLEEYKTKIMVLGTQVTQIEKDIDWLILKINRLRDAGQKPSRDMVASVTSKEEKIKILLKEKTRLENLSSIYSKSCDLRMKTERTQTLAAIIGSQKTEAKEKTAKAIVTQAIVAQAIVAEKSSPAVLKKKSLPKPISIQSNTIKKSKIEAAVKRADLDDWVVVNGDDTCLRIETTLPILFSSGSAKVAKEYQPFLKKLASFLKPYDVKILVNGYADTVPIKSNQYPSNFELGAARAANIVHQLVNQGLKPSIFKIETTGEYRFAAKEPSQQKSFERRARVTVIFTG